QPFRSVLDAGFVMVHSHRFQPAQHLHRAVDVVDTPAPKPGTIRLLLLLNKLDGALHGYGVTGVTVGGQHLQYAPGDVNGGRIKQDRKSTRLNSSHRTISYAVFCLKKKKTIQYTNIHTKTSIIISKIV